MALIQQLTPYERYQRRKSALWAERASWDAHWMDISRVLLPRAGRFTWTAKNKGGKVNQDIYDSTGTKALRVLAAGLMAGMTSPARPWFRLTTNDPDLAEHAPVKDWLFRVTRLMRLIFDRSNTYRALHSLYEELGAFGTAATVVEANFDTVLHHTPLTIGEYAIAVNYERNVNTLVREFSLPVSAVVKEFGKENCSLRVQRLWDESNLDAEVPVCHLIQPREYSDRVPGKRDGKNMPFASIYFEQAGSAGSGGMIELDKKVLRESGFRRFPALAPRWATSGGDIYGSCPGMDALGDVKQLQFQQLQKSKAIAYMADPPLQAPTSMRNKEHDLLPGGVSFVDQTNPGGGVRTAFDVNLRLDFLLADIQDVRERVNSAFYADLFLMLANDDRRQPATAREIAERHEEKLLMLGPVTERLTTELFSPLVDLTFDRIMEARIMPPPPKELQGSQLEVKLVGLLAQAQRAVGLGSVDRLIGTVASVSQLQAALGRQPDALDKLDTDQMIDAYSEMLGVDPDLVVADENVAIIRQERATQQQMQEAAAQAPVVADTAKKMSETDTSKQSALTDAMQRFSGYGGA